MTRKFTQKVQMPCTAAQYRIIHPDLRKLGYECLEPGGPENMILLFISNGVCSYSSIGMAKVDYISIDTFSPSLFLALAAMSEGEFYEGEHVWDPKRDRMYKIEKIEGDFEGIAFLTNQYDTPVRRLTKATIAEIFQQLSSADDAPRKGGWNETHDGEASPMDNRRFVTALQDIGYGGSLQDENSFDKGLAYQVFREDENLFVVIDNEGKQVSTTYKLFRDSTVDEIKTHFRNLAAVKKLDKACEKRAGIPPAPEGRTIREGGSDEKSFFDQVSQEADSSTEANIPVKDKFELMMDSYLDQLDGLIQKYSSVKKELSSSTEASETPQPPLGIMPRKIWEEKRIKKLMLAILRYLDADKELRDEWVSELNELLNKRAENLPF